MSDPELPGAEYWRSRAEEIRTKAELMMHDPVAAQHRPCEPTDGLAPAERLLGSLALLLTDCDLLRRMKFDLVGDRRAPVRDLYDLNTLRCPAEA